MPLAYTQSQTVQTILDTTFKVDDALIFDKAGNLYGSNFNGDAVYKLTPSGQISVFSNGFCTPNGLAFDTQENLFVVDPTANRIIKVDQNGNHIDTVPMPGASGIIKAWNSDTMIVGIYFGHVISKLSPDGVLTPWLQGAPLNGPVGFTYDDQNNLFVGNFNNREIYRLDKDSIVYIAQVPGRANGTGALGFITYTHGLIYGTSYNTHKILIIFFSSKGRICHPNHFRCAFLLQE